MLVLFLDSPSPTKLRLSVWLVVSGGLTLKNNVILYFNNRATLATLFQTSNNCHCLLFSRPNHANSRESPICSIRKRRRELYHKNLRRFSYSWHLFFSGTTANGILIIISKNECMHISLSCRTVIRSVCETIHKLRQASRPCDLLKGVFFSCREEQGYRCSTELLCCCGFLLFQECFNLVLHVQWVDAKVSSDRRTFMIDQKFDYTTKKRAK